MLLQALKEIANPHLRKEIHEALMIRRLEQAHKRGESKSRVKEKPVAEEEPPLLRWVHVRKNRREQETIYGPRRCRRTISTNVEEKPKSDKKARAVLMLEEDFDKTIKRRRSESLIEHSELLASQRSALSSFRLKLAVE
jgi:hypothetical protein